MDGDTRVCHQYKRSGECKYGTGYIFRHEVRDGQPKAARSVNFYMRGRGRQQPAAAQPAQLQQDTKQAQHQYDQQQYTNFQEELEEYRQMHEEMKGAGQHDG